MTTDSQENTQTQTLPTFSLAVKAFTEGRFSDAESHCHTAMEQDSVPKPEGFLLLGMIAQRKGDQPSAMKCFEKTIEFDPNNPDYYTVLGDVYQTMGKDDAALQAFRHGLSLDPENAFLHERLGTVLFAQNKKDEALFHLREGVRLAPEEGKPYLALANALRKENPTEAVNHYLDSLKYGPGNEEAFFQLGNTLQQLYNQQQNLESGGSADYLEQAVNVYMECIRLDPHHAEAYYNLGNAYLKLELPDEAKTAYEQSIHVDPTNALSFNNLGIVLRCQLRLDEAIEAYRQSIALDPDFMDAHHNLGVVQLMKGQLAEAWPEYEWRTHKNTYDRGTQLPYWKGDAFANQTLMVWCEGGYGDTFQFIRYLPQVKALGGKVVLVAQPALSRLLQPLCESNEWVDTYVERDPDESLEMVLESLAQGHPELKFDQYVGTMSFPALFKTELDTVPSQHPYIPAPLDLLPTWKQRLSTLAPDSKLKVGVVWSGTVTMPTLLRRACPLEAFGPMTKLPGVSFFSLQVGKGQEELAVARSKGIKVLPLAEEFKDFADTAAAIENLDVIVTIDTGVAHLAAAMGKRVWMVLPYSPDWRWLTGREDTPWYPTMRLFRQATLGDWTPVMEAVYQELEALRNAQ